MRISDWSSDVCSSDLCRHPRRRLAIRLEKPSDDHPRRCGGGKLARVMVEVGIHKALEIALFVAHRRREAGERHPGGAHVLYRLDLAAPKAIWRQSPRANCAIRW